MNTAYNFFNAALDYFNFLFYFMVTCLVDNYILAFVVISI